MKACDIQRRASSRSHVSCASCEKKFLTKLGAHINTYIMAPTYDCVANTARTKFMHLADSSHNSHDNLYGVAAVPKGDIHIPVYAVGPSASAVTPPLSGRESRVSPNSIVPESCLTSPSCCSRRSLAFAASSSSAIFRVRRRTRKTLSQEGVG